MKQAEVVYLLTEIQPATARELARYDDTTQGGVEGTLRQLEENGLVEHQQCLRGADGRPAREYKLVPLEEVWDHE